MARKLTVKQEKFCHHYAINGEAGAAYRVAYDAANSNDVTCRVEGNKLLKIPSVALRIAELQQRVCEIAEDRFNVTAEKVLQELAIIAFANVQDYVKVDDNGIPMPDFSKVTRRQFAAIGEVKFEDIESGARVGKRVTFKLLDKKGALVDLGRHLGLFKDDKPQAGNTVNINVISDAAADFDRRMVELAARVVADEVARTDEPAGQSAPALPLGILGTAGTA